VRTVGAGLGALFGTERVLLGFKTYRAQALSLVALCVTLTLTGPPAAAQERLHLALDYEGSLFLKVLDVSIDQVLGADAFSASAHIRTSGVLALFRKLDLKAESQGRVDNPVVLPGVFTYLNTDGKKNRHVTAIWTSSDVTTLSQPRYTNMGEPPATREQKLEAADPLTILTRLTVLPAGQTPCQGVSQFYDGKQRYDIVYTYKGPAPLEARERRLGLTNPLRCSLVYHEVAGFKKKPVEQRSQGLRREVTLGLGRLGSGGPWVISFLRADTFLGAAEIDLVRVKTNGEHRS